jgi:trehalose 6-phosphate synthase
MNLVAKEYVASRCDDNGVLILSDFAGASRELTEAIVVNPFHEDELSKAILQALEMPPEERTRRMRRMRAVVAENNIYRWAAKIILDLSPKSLLKNRDLHVLQASSDAIAG